MSEIDEDYTPVAASLTPAEWRRVVSLAGEFCDEAGTPEDRVAVDKLKAWAEEVECLSRLYVACREENERLVEVLREIADGYERHNPGWWIKKAKAAISGDGA